LARLIVYLVGVGAMGTIAQGVVGRSLHDVVWTTHERPIKAQTHVVTETTPLQTVTITGETVTRPGAPGKTLTAPVTTALVTVPSPTTTTTTTTTTVPGPAVTTTVAAKTETVPVLGPTVTTTLPGRTVTTTVPGPTVTTTVPGPTVTTTAPGPTETVTVTVAAECDPPPKKPSNPPCPPHK
jgi:hypothetical protein